MREHFRWLKGEEKLSSFESSPGKLRYFCSMCGSHLVAERLNQPHVIVRAATLPEDFTEKLTEAVVGIEMVLTRLIGKWKASQNQPLQNQRSVIQGLNASGQSEAVAMAALVNAGVNNAG